MGNLYTHVVRKHDQRIEILSKLKYQFRCSPRNWNEINKLRDELSKYDLKHPLPQRKIIKGIFGKRQGV